MRLTFRHLQWDLFRQEGQKAGRETSNVWQGIPTEPPDTDCVRGSQGHPWVP